MPASGPGLLRMLLAGGVMRPDICDGGARGLEDAAGLDGVYDLESLALALAGLALSELLSMLERHLLNPDMSCEAFGVAKLDNDAMAWFGRVALCVTRSFSCCSI